MATVTIVRRSRKNGLSYVINYVDPETKRKKYHGTFRKWSDADREKTKLKALLEGGESPESPKARTLKYGKTFGEIGELCRDEWKRRAKEGSLSQTTLDGYEYTLASLVEKWGTRPIGTITEKSVLDLRADIAARHSPAWSNRHLFIIKQVFKRAVRGKGRAQRSDQGRRQPERKTA